MRTSSQWTWVLAGILCLLVSTNVSADRNEEFELLPDELAHVKVYEIAIPVSRVEPKYPKPALDRQMEADVWIKALISKTGKVLQAGVVHCSTEGFGFEYAARTAAEQFAFEPILKHGEPQTCWCYFRVPFRLSEAATPAETPLPGPDDFVPVDQPPEMTRQAVPVYPDSCLLLGVSDCVWVKALVDTKGNVRDARIAKPCAVKCGLEEAALNAARENKFKPALADGKPVAVWVTIRVEFTKEAKQGSS